MAISMKFHGKYGWAAGAVALCLSAAAISSGSASPGDSDFPVVSASLHEDFRSTPDATAADVAQRFEDAPYGVDPVVTGPVSTAFKQQRQAAGCDTAVWPKVPAACYPD
ncbi:hypothetical protein ACSBOB_07405 [Mesorhizobium sp. ASY16-5R]|uniref:hypothetical protein n=1 Tax=Mesorhizobium sp. ASY16-5R TaxID=3445772 RepID=UPI003F9FD34A